MNKELSKNLKRLLIISLLIIILSSLEALINAKSLEAFKIYQEVFPEHNIQDYLSFIVLNYIFNIFEPIVLSLFLYFTRNRLKPNKLYGIVFGGMIGIKLLNKFLTFNIGSIFYYILLALYILLLISTVRYSTKREE